jgi:catechol 2,3-dioxygenase-like lactoylglutathione lyase family enzyme
VTTTTGCHHVALVTEDLDRLLAFHREVFDAQVVWVLDEEGTRHAAIELGGGFHLHAFELAGGNPHARGRPDMFARGHLDHLALEVPDEVTLQDLRRRLVDRGASDGTLHDFGSTRQVWFDDPDGHRCEVVLAVPCERPRTLSELTDEPYVRVGAGR